MVNLLGFLSLMVVLAQVIALVVAGSAQTHTRSEKHLQVTERSLFDPTGKGTTTWSSLPACCYAEQPCSDGRS
jgi:hypothetical protein